MKSPFKVFVLVLIITHTLIFTTVIARNSEYYEMTQGGENFSTRNFENTDNLQVVSNFRDFGRNSVGMLCEANNGKLYGMTQSGGVNDKGILFEWDPATNTFSKKFDFNGSGNGLNPLGSLMKANTVSFME